MPGGDETKRRTAAMAGKDDVIDLTEGGDAPPSPKRQRLADPTRERPAVGGIFNPGRPGLEARPIQYLTLPNGVLDDAILMKVDAIAQQLNCVGCDGRGLAEGVQKKLPYGCSYLSRRRMPPQNKFAVQEDRAQLGKSGLTILRSRAGYLSTSSHLC